jgi:hypothetical protein
LRPGNISPTRIIEVQNWRENLPEHKFINPAWLSDYDYEFTVQGTDSNFNSGRY